MAFQAAKEFLEKRGFGDRIKEFDVSSATVELAAVAVGCEPAHIAKTLSFLTGEGPVLIVAAGDAKIDNHKYKSFFGVKAKMLTVEQVSELTTNTTCAAALTVSTPWAARCFWMSAARSAPTRRRPTG